MISWWFGLFGLIEKVNWFSAQRKLICKGLTYLLYVNSFGLSLNFRPNGLAQSFRSVLRTESEQKNRLHFLVELSLSPNFGLSEKTEQKTNPKSEVAHCLQYISCIDIRSMALPVATACARWISLWINPKQSKLIYYFASNLRAKRSYDNRYFCLTHINW